MKPVHIPCGDDIDDATFAHLCKLFGYTPKNRRLTNDEAAELLGWKPTTLEVKRVQGRGPRLVRVPGARRIQYTERDVIAFLGAGLTYSTSSEERATA